MSSLWHRPFPPFGTTPSSPSPSLPFSSVSSPFSLHPHLSSSLPSPAPPLFGTGSLSALPQLPSPLHSSASALGALLPPISFGQTGPNEGPSFGPVWPNEGPFIRSCLAKWRASIRLGQTKWPLFGQTGPNRGPLFGLIWPNVEPVLEKGRRWGRRQRGRVLGKRKEVRRRERRQERRRRGGVLGKGEETRRHRRGGEERRRGGGEETRRHRTGGEERRRGGGCGE